MIKAQAASVGAPTALGDYLLRTDMKHRVAGTVQTVLPRVLLTCPVSEVSVNVSERMRLWSNLFRNQRWPYQVCAVDTTSGDELPEGGFSRDVIARLRDLWHYGRDIVRAIRQHDIVHVVLPDSTDMTTTAFLPVFLGRFFGKRIIIDCRGSLAELQPRQPGPLRARILRLSDRVVASSDSLAGLLRREQIGCEVLGEAFDPLDLRPRNIQSVQPRILCVQSPHAVSDAGLLMKAFKLVKEKYPRSEMVILGTGSRRSWLVESAAAARLSGMTFESKTDPVAMLHHLKSADLYIETSSPGNDRTSLLRALASGLPVVSETCRASDVITDRINGLIVREGNPAHLADRIIELVESPELVRQLSEQAKLTARKFAWPHVSRQWLDIYRDL
ncbi:MAG: glycosyltransferase family 4 protein [candidate division Zixibacteria bacterium]|nr:glycosyltransferase family 4 protein [candidate division Zixibacteria bacterium]